MAKVICTSPNASTLISGVRFVEHKLGMISEEIEDAVAAEFTAIKGYVLAEAKKVQTAVDKVTGKSSKTAAASTSTETPPVTDPDTETKSADGSEQTPPVVE